MFEQTPTPGLDTTTPTPLSEEVILMQPLEEEVIPVPTSPVEDVIRMQPSEEEVIIVPIPMEPTERVDEHNTMLLPYPKYNNEPDVEAHIRAFLTTWQANHVSV